MHCRRQPIFIANQMFEHPAQPSSIVLEIANARAMILMKQDDDDTDWEISNDDNEEPGQSTFHLISKKTIWTSSKISYI
jgi:hypothetical protein